MADEKRRIPVRARLDEHDDDDLVGPRSGASTPSSAEPEVRARPRRSPRTAAKRARAVRPAPRLELDLRGFVREIPHFLKLLWGLAKDPRVSKADKAIVVGALAYAALPADLIPDWIPGLGEIEDVFLVALALSRLLTHAGEEVLMDHWEGDEETLAAAIDALEGATQFLPSGIRGLLTGHR
ncbi:MAG: YkvA family protein [Longimicrobiaceae bacterium]